MTILSPKIVFSHFFIPSIYLAKNLRNELTIKVNKKRSFLLHNCRRTCPQIFHKDIYLSTKPTENFFRPSVENFLALLKQNI
jgi:hypothetical protein